MTTAELGRLVVGLNGTPESQRAVRWAAREAALRGRPLHIVRAFTTPLEELARVHLPAEAVALESLRSSAEHEVHRVVEECARTWPDLSISTETRLGHPTAVLRDASEHGAMLVLGTARHGAISRAVLGSTAAELLRKVHLPVVVVREEHESGHTRRVVVGVDGSRSSTGAVGFAFDHAARHGAELVAALAWDELPRDAIPPAGGWKLDWADVTRGCERELAESLAGWQEQYPDVVVRPEVTTAELPTEILLRLAAEADLIVVGRHGRALMRFAMLGSTSHSIAHYAPCPVAVVR